MFKILSKLLNWFIKVIHFITLKKLPMMVSVSAIIENDNSDLKY